MSSLGRSLGTLLVLIAVLAGAPAARSGPLAPRPPATPLPATASPCPPAWRLVAGPNPTWRYNQLRALAVVSAADVWAVGTASGRPLAAHWDGSAWSVAPMPNTGLNTVTLYGAAALGPNDVWAVGSGYTANGDEQTLIVHWDGSAWRRVPSPNPGTYSNALSSVTAIAPDDVWAAGTSYTEGGAVTPILIVHWDGRAWSRVAAPWVVPGDLRALDAVAADDIWAVGVVGEEPLTLHWDGTAWSQVFLPRLAGHTSLSSVAAIAADDVWAVGGYWNPMNFRGGALIEHWDGAAWTRVPLLAASYPMISGLSGVTAVTAQDVWVGGATAGRIVMLHWNGSAWSQVPGPETAGQFSVTGVAAVAAGDIWAIGGYNLYTGSDRTGLLHYTDTCGPPAPPPEGCVLPFTDVDAGHPFYSNIQCLYCSNILDGYSDGTFRPDAGVTRGQVTKLVATARGMRWSIPPDRQSFADVPPSHPFWVYIEEVYGAGLISGYSDGTFRPGNSVTRGQMSKFASNAAGYADAIPPAQQSFSDVPPADPFWLFIERAHLHGVIDGYSDGTFRPGASVTRGQAAKFISNAFFPGCGPLR